MNVTEYIKKNIGNTVCYNPDDRDGMFGLPCPYSVPTVGETFHAMFYWDTYFTDLALLALGDIEQAKNNVANFASLIDRFGYIPNGNKIALFDRSQPPFFSLMVRDIFNITNDKAWLYDIYPSLCREHSFWINNRSTKIGLAHYGTSVLPEREEMYARAFSKRIGVEYTPEKQHMLAENFLSQAESGWDFTARFELDSVNYCPADLNSLLWALEDNLSKFAEILDNGDSSKWRELADLRAERMRNFLKDERGVFCDRNAETNRFSPYTSTASLYPLFVGLANDEEAKATLTVLPKLLFNWGIVPCEPTDGATHFQWGAPNGWPCLQVVAAVGLKNYGYTEEAENIAALYTQMVENVFEGTGALWEKYNLASGKSDALNEYEMPEMLGWTAGAYLYFKNMLKK